MAYATWLIGTANITSTVKFGMTGGFWMKLPDSAPPLQFVQTSSIALPGDGDYRGCVVTCIDTTTVGHVIHTGPRQVSAYVKGDKWVRMVSDPALSFNGADKLERMYTRVELYYRDQQEGGSIP